VDALSSLIVSTGKVGSWYFSRMMLEALGIDYRDIEFTGTWIYGIRMIHSNIELSALSQPFIAVIIHRFYGHIR
jgi:hypothetical protein